MLSSKKHPDNEQLIGYILNSRDNNITDISNHLEKCEGCKRLVTSMKSILQKSDNAEIVPSDKVVRNITSFLNDQQSTKKFPDAESIRNMILRPAVVSLIILCAIGLLFTFKYFKTSSNSEKINFSFSNFKGKVYHENNILQNKVISVNKGSISTESNSSALLKLDTFMTINIAENTELIIKSATIEKNNSDNFYVLDFELKAGSIYAEWNDHNKHKSFTISTKYAHIKTLGTSFILSEEKNLSRLAVIKGRVQATLLESGNTLIINSGEGFISDGTSKKININAEYELSRFEELFNGNDDKPAKNNEKPESYEKPGKEEADNQIKNKEIQKTEIKKTRIDQIRNENKEMRKESKKIQREMRKNSRSGSKLRR